MSRATHDVPSPRTLLCRNSLGSSLRVPLKIAESLFPDETGDCSSDSTGPEPEHLCLESRLTKRLHIVITIKKQYRDAGIQAPEFLEDMGTESKLMMTKRPWERECFRARHLLRELLCQIQDESNEE